MFSCVCAKSHTSHGRVPTQTINYHISELNMRIFSSLAETQVWGEKSTAAAACAELGGRPSRAREPQDGLDRQRHGMKSSSRAEVTLNGMQRVN